MRSTKILLALSALTAASVASAAPTLITVVGEAPVPQVPMSVSFNGGVTYSTPAVEEYIVTSTNPAGTFASFCLEPFEHLTTPWVYDNSGSFTPAVAGALSRLFTGAGWQSNNSSGDSVTTNVQRVGLGLAVWDIFIDGGVFNLTGGTVQVADDGFGGAAVAFAQAAYAAGNTSLAPYLVRLTDPVKQDLVIAVPEPETYALMVAGLMAVGFVARRRRT